MRCCANILGKKGTWDNAVHLTGVSTPMILNPQIEAAALADRPEIASPFDNFMPLPITQVPKSPRRWRTYAVNRVAPLRAFECWSTRDTQSGYWLARRSSGVPIALAEDSKRIRRSPQHLCASQFGRLSASGCADFVRRSPGGLLGQDWTFALRCTAKGYARRMRTVDGTQ